MKGKPVHQNLNTSFVDLPALVKHLLGLQFAGSIRVEFSSYEAEIIFTGTGTLQAREYDKFLGRIAQGERAYRRILARAKEPQGRILVTQAAAEESAAYIRKPFVDERIIADARLVAFGGGDRLARVCAITLRPVASNSPNHETEAVELAAELLLTVKEAFAKSRLNFERAFANACEATAKDFAFLRADKGHFAFAGDEIRVSERISTDELFEGIVAALRQLLNRMRIEAKFAKVLALSRHHVHQHLSSRHGDYKRLGLIETVDRLFI